MSATRTAVHPLAQALRAARKGRRLSIAQLALMAEVSPRLISELERGMRAHVSLETAMRLLHLVGVAVRFEPPPAPAEFEAAARFRAEQRRRHWTGAKSTLSMQASPPPSSDAAERLTAVAYASRLAAGLQTAYRATTVTRTAKSTE